MVIKQLLMYFCGNLTGMWRGSEVVRAGTRQSLGGITELALFSLENDNRYGQFSKYKLAFV